MTAYQFYTAAFRAADRALAEGDIKAAAVAVNHEPYGSLPGGAAWRLAAVALRDAVEGRGGFAVEAMSRQARDCAGPIFNGLDLRDIRPADRDMIEEARAWAMVNGRLSAELVPAHCDQCRYFLLAL